MYREIKRYSIMDNDLLNHCIQLIDMQIDLQISTFLSHYITLQ